MFWKYIQIKSKIICKYKQEAALDIRAVISSPLSQAKDEFIQCDLHHCYNNQKPLLY